MSKTISINISTGKKRPTLSTRAAQRFLEREAMVNTKIQERIVSIRESKQ